VELYFLDDNFNYASAPIDDYLSLTWIDRYQAAGEFSLSLSPDLAKDAMRAAYLMNSERGIMEITGVSYSAAGQRKLTVTGNGLLWLLARRIITADGQSSNAVGTIIRTRVTSETNTTARALPLPLSYDVSTASDQITATYNYGENLYEWAIKLLQRTYCGASITLDRSANKLNLRVYKGLNRTQNQTTNSRAIFSQSFGNIRELEIKKSILDYKNVCIAYNGTAYTLDGTGGTEPRREFMISVDSEAGDTTKRAECSNALAECRKVDSVSGTADQSDMRYLTDYNVGDFCDIADDYTGIMVSARITEVSTIYEKGAARVIPSFGNQFMSLRDFVKHTSNFGRVTYVTINPEA